MNFDMKKPCANCPFKKNGAIELRPGRLEGIVQSLKRDTNFFQCHKTVHSKRGGEWDEDTYIPSGQESVCAGSLIYALKANMGLPVAARVAVMFGQLDLAALEAQADTIIDPLENGD